ncbi:PAS domain-containing protein [Gilvimarinus polysaccharolyticus]|uniref:PAS domain-containing protein n=1 Tax=Gilvimarinus polysaccharolyticus TaxID=863921 RepID=UPI000673AD59|nr:PAS domain-containing protein [Gilvimarinus polysaccharolyticus]
MIIKEPNVSITQDLTNLTTDQLREIAYRYQRIFCGCGYGFWEWDLETNHINWSGAFWQQLGYAELDKEVFYDANQLPSYIHPDDRNIMFEAVREHLRSSEPLRICYRIRNKAGKYIWVQVLADSIRDDQGRARYISGLNFDITELKNVEQALRESEARQVRIIQASKDGIWEWYAEDDSFHFSNRCWEHLGYNENDDIVTRGQDRLSQWRDHIHIEDLPKFDHTLRKHMLGRGAFDIEYRVNTKQGETRWIRARGRACFDEQGQPTRMSGTNMDITSIKRAEERVMQAKEDAEKANRAKSDFLSSMSHELRTPLNAILGYTQLFEYDDNLHAVQKDNLREIRSAGAHLLRLINDVLDLAKIESGNIDAELQPVLVTRVIADCFTLVRHQADARGIFLHAKYQNLDDACVTADPGRLKQALLNLLSNSIKYNRVGGEVEVSLSAREDHFLRISVRDTGVGIAPHLYDSVFQPFNRLHAELSGVEGTGVGLAITKQLVEIMRGRIGFTSEVDSGTCFWLDLEHCGKAVNKTPKNVVEVDLASADTLINKRSCRMLYIEDNLANIRLIQQFLSRYDNYLLEVAEEPFLGIYHARNSRPDVILLDIDMPGLDGYEVLKVLQKDPATALIPIIGLSANIMCIDEQKGRTAGFYQYLSKPLQINQLVLALNQLAGETEAAALISPSVPAQPEG